MFKILIWGTGNRTTDLLDKGCFNKCEIIGYVDNDETCKAFRDLPVYHSSEVSQQMIGCDYLVIVSGYYKEIARQTIKMKLDWDKIVVIDDEDEYLLKEAFERLKNIDFSLYNQNKNKTLLKVVRNECDLNGDKMLIGNGDFSGWEYIPYEYFRYRTFEFVAKEINMRGVKGAVAELGVFRGTFSALINELFPDRMLYMFDTFEGFDAAEAEREINLGRCDQEFIDVHQDTSDSIVMAKLSHPEKGVICKGLFPASITESARNEKYAFVSIDVDFEESTFQGLSFFYPRMSDNGVIFIHDYNTYYLEGVKAAVHRYEKECGIMLKSVPIADRAGTLVIIK